MNNFTKKFLNYYYFNGVDALPSLKQKLIKNFVDSHVLPHIRKVWIETVNFCNLRCPICPTGLSMRHEDNTFMSMDLFQRIVDLLLDYDDTENLTICPFGHGEPLLDNLLIDKIKYVRARIPRCSIELHTNATLIPVYFDGLINSGLTKLVMNLYNPETKQICLNMLSQYNLQEFSKKIIIEWRIRYIETDSGYKMKHESWYTNRAGVIKLGGVASDTPCILPFFQLAIDVNGNIKQCCYDTIGVTVFDNVQNYTNINDLWYSDKYSRIRDKIMQSRKNLPHCKNCNTNDNEVMKSEFLEIV